MAALNNFVRFLFTLSIIFSNFEFTLSILNVPIGFNGRSPESPGYTHVTNWKEFVVKLSGKESDGSGRVCHGVAVSNLWILTIKSCVRNLIELTAKYYDGTEEQLRLNERVDERPNAKADYNDFTVIRVKNFSEKNTMPCLTPDDVRERRLPKDCLLAHYKVNPDETLSDQIIAQLWIELDDKTCSKMLKEEYEEWLLSDSEDCYISSFNPHNGIAPSYDAHTSLVGAPIYCAFKDFEDTFYLVGIVGRVWPVQQLLKSFPIVVALSHDRYDWFNTALKLSHSKDCVYEDMSEFEIENVRYSPATRTTRGVSSNKKPFSYLITLLILVTILTY